MTSRIIVAIVAVLSLAFLGPVGCGGDDPTPAGPSTTDTGVIHGPLVGISVTRAGASVTVRWTNPRDPDIANYLFLVQPEGSEWPIGEWRAVPDSDGSTTSFTVDLSNYAEYGDPLGEWTILIATRTSADGEWTASGHRTEVIVPAASG